MNNIVEKIAQQIAMSAQLKKLKADEMKLRKELCAHFLKNKHVGTHNFTEGNYQVKVVKKNTTSVDPDEIAGLFESFSPAEKDCVAFKPSLIAKEYSSLDPDDRETLDMCLVVKPAAPTFSAVLVEED